jgi:hypothetical protein
MITLGTTSNPHNEPSYHHSTTRTSTTQLHKRHRPLTTICQPTTLPQPPNGLPFSRAAPIDRDANLADSIAQNSSDLVDA